MRQQALETRKAIIDWLDETCDVGIQQLKDAKNDRIKNVNSNCDSFLKWLDERQQEIEEKLTKTKKYKSIMKNFKFKWLLLSIILSIASINTAWAVTYNPSGVAQQTMQSQQVMQTGGAYNGTVYEPFSNTTPSEASNPAKAPGGPRRAYDSEGNWIPDAPDIETAGDTGNSNESPIGEPWVMLLMALAFGGVIMVRQMRKKIIKQENNTQNKSTMKGQKFIAILVMLLTLGVGQMWADDMGFFKDGQWKVGYNTGGGSDTWTDYQNKESSYDIGIVTSLTLKGCNAKTWQNGSWSVSQVDWFYSWSSGVGTYKEDHSSVSDLGGGNKEWYCSANRDLISIASNNPGNNTLYMFWEINEWNQRQSGISSLTFTIPGFTTTSTSQNFSSTVVDGESSTIKISFGNHYGTALTTGNCSLLTDFTVTAIDETGVTVKFTPKSAGSKSEILTITDEHGKTCSITLTG